MKRIFAHKLWMRILAVLLAFSLNLGAIDGLVRYAASGTALTDFQGFLEGSEAKEVSSAKDEQPEKNKNKLPDTAGPKQPKNAAAEEAKDNSEVKSKRTVNSKTFKIGEGEYKTEVYPEPVHYFNEKNELTDIDNTLIASKERGFAFENRANFFKVRFSDKAKDRGLGQAGQKDFLIRWGLLNGQEAEGSTAKNTITYREITKGADLRYVVEGSKLKEEIILNNPDAPAEFKFAIELKNLDYKMQQDGSIDFVDGKGTVIWTMPKPFMYDDAGTESQAVKAGLDYENGKLVLTVQADREWLSAGSRQQAVSCCNRPNSAARLEIWSGYVHFFSKSG